jgi:hypothetical protein
MVDDPYIRENQESFVKTIGGTLEARQTALNEFVRENSYVIHGGDQQHINVMKIDENE